MELDNLLNKHVFVPEVLEFVFINSIIYCPDYGRNNLNDKQKEWNKILTLSAKLNEKLDKNWIENQGIFNYLHKGVLNQLKSGSEDFFHYYRYYYIFSKRTISDHIESVLGMPYHDFYICSMWIYSIFKQQSFAVDKNYFFQSKQNGTMISEENIRRTLSILSISLADLRSVLKKEIVYDMNTFITHEYSHVRFPIIENNDIIFCLFRNQLLNQITSGMYYVSEIYKNDKLSKPFGDGFEDYVELVLNRCNLSNKMQIRKEIKYIKKDSEARTSDIIIESAQDIVFIECKTKRLRIESKKYSSVLPSDINEIVKAVVQVYKVYSDYSNNLIPDLSFAPNKSFVPLVVTLEEWYAGTPDVADDIAVLVKSSLRELNLDDAITDEFKYHIISIANFEKEAQIMFVIGFSNYFDQLKRGKLNKEEFKYRNLFDDDFYNSFIKPLEKQFTDMKIK